jgi:hypothetical protein
LVKYSLGIMAGDTVALAAVLDAMYARSGGGSVDTARLAPNFLGMTKTYLGQMAIRNANGEVGAGDAGQFRIRHPTNDTYTMNFGFNTSSGQFGYINVWSGGALTNGKIALVNKTIVYTTDGSATVDSALQVGHGAYRGGLHIYGGGLFHGGIGTGGQAPRIGRRLDVVGAAAVSDTLRVGDYSTFSYVIPGGDWVVSSTGDIKTDISAIETPADFEARILAVSPKRYRFKPEAFLRGVSDTLKGKALTKALAEDAAQAAKQSERVMTGFIAEEFNPAFSANPSSKEIHTSEIIAALWKQNQELLKRVKALETRVAVLVFESEIKKGE